MAIPFELAGTPQGELVSARETNHSNIWKYSCELSSQHVDPAILPHIPAGYTAESYDQWLSSLTNSEDQLGHMANWIKATIHQMPGGIDIARDVDGGGFTEDRVTPTLFTSWAALDNSTYVRLSEARTAMHNTTMTTKGTAKGGALRSPVMGGVVLEATSTPTSTDPRNAVSLAIYEFAREEDARYPWLSPRPGRLFDLTQFAETPYFVGPLYNGHPNEVTDSRAISTAINAGVLTLRLIIDSNLANQ
jgi:hypothetical protein